VVTGSFAGYRVLQASCRTTSDEEHERDKCLRVSDKSDEWWKKDVPKNVQPRCCVAKRAGREEDTPHALTGYKQPDGHVGEATLFGTRSGSCGLKALKSSALDCDLPETSAPMQISFSQNVTLPKV
jgi:hypothetical protein